MEELLARREELKRRLLDGQEKIELAKRQNRPTEVIHKAEERWARLLEEYEEVEDLIRILQAERDTPADAP